MTALLAFLAGLCAGYAIRAFIAWVRDARLELLGMSEAAKIEHQS